MKELCLLADRTWTSMFFNNRLIGVQSLLAGESTLMLLRGMILTTDTIRAVTIHKRLAKMRMPTASVELGEENSVAHCSK